MEDYIQISKLNDFLFCPKSIYLHELYGQYEEKTYHETAQVVGKIAHESIDNKTYSTEKKYLQSLDVYSEKYNLCGKIDIYDSQSKSLIERKYKIKEIYPGHKYQLYAQYFCLLEAGFEVDNLYIHSLSDNKRYKIDLPNESETAKFEELLLQINNFDIACDDKTEPNLNKCQKCIYRHLCDSYIIKKTTNDVIPT